MKRLSIMIAALVVAAVLVLPQSTDEARAQEGGLTGDLAPAGVSLATWGGGDADAVVAAAATAGCNLVSF